MGEYEEARQRSDAAQQGRLFSPPKERAVARQQLEEANRTPFEKLPLSRQNRLRSQEAQRQARLDQLAAQESGQIEGKKSVSSVEPGYWDKKTPTEAQVASALTKANKAHQAKYPNNAESYSLGSSGSPAAPINDMYAHIENLREDSTTNYSPYNPDYANISVEHHAAVMALANKAHEATFNADEAHQQGNHQLAAQHLDEAAHALTAGVMHLASQRSVKGAAADISDSLLPVVTEGAAMNLSKEYANNYGV